MKKPLLILSLSVLSALSGYSQSAAVRADLSTSPPTVDENLQFTGILDASAATFTAPTTYTLDTEWDTLAKINAATTDDDAVGFLDIDTFAELDALVADQTLLNTATGYTQAAANATFATAAQGTLAGTATQPGDDAATLGSGAATDGQVLTADGAGNAAYESLPAASATASGLVELATSTEASAGTDASRAVSPSALMWAAAAIPEYYINPDMFSTATTGTGSVSAANIQTSLQTGTTAGSTALARTQGNGNAVLPFNLGNGGAGQPDYDHEFFIISQFAGMGQGTSTGVRRFYIGKTATSTVGDLSTIGFGFKLTGNSQTTSQLVLQIHNGTTLTESSAVNADGLGWEHVPFILHNLGDGTVDLYYGAADIIAGTPTISLDGSITGTTGANNCQIVFEVENGANAANHRLDAGMVKVMGVRNPNH